MPRGKLFGCLFLLLACAKPAAQKTPASKKLPPALCGDRLCADGEQCLALESAPTSPACVSAGDCHAVPLGRDLFGEALNAVGLSRCTATLPADYLARWPSAVQHDPYRLSHFATAHDSPLTAPHWADGLARAFGDPARLHVAGESIAEAAARLGFPLQTEPPPHAVDSGAPLAMAMVDLLHARGGTADGSALSKSAVPVPASLQKKIARILYALIDAAAARDRAFAAVTDLPAAYHLAPSLLLTSADGAAFDPSLPAVRDLLTKQIGWTDLYQGAHDLAAAVENAALETETGARGFSFDVDTPLGRVVIADAADQIHDDTAGPVLLLVDTGGNDTYRFPAGASSAWDHPISVVIDLAGDDTYGYTEVADPGDSGRLPSDHDGRFISGDVTKGETARSKSDQARQGAGRCGIGMLFDFAGNDHYRSLRMSQGFGALGVGVLVDRAGDDVYEAEAGAQGAAVFGIGLLLDGTGNDRHRIYSYGQGFGFVKGFGALVDGSGDDDTFADPGAPDEGGDPLYFSPQLPGRGNTSFVQGAGFGRADSGAGAGSMSGGIGVLVDLAGSDHYTASVFGQGAAYFFGTGILVDAGGDDRYEGKWYLQGAAAHNALAVFHDLAGDDRYNTGTIKPVATSMGVGHDFSVGWMIDDAGNDIYNAPGLALGAGNACGWGFFIDGGGDDTYTASADRTLGAVGETADDAFYAARPTIGVSVDRGGSNAYTLGVQTVRRAGKLTTTDADPKAPLAKGVQLDADGALLVLP